MIESLLCSLAALIGYGVWVQWKLNRDQNKINEIVFETIKIHAEIIKNHGEALEQQRTRNAPERQRENLGA